MSNKSISSYSKEHMISDQLTKTFRGIVMSVILFTVVALDAPVWAHPPKQVVGKAPLTTRQIADRCLPAVVMITVRGKDGQVMKTGSGFVVATNLIATNLHVVRDAHEVTINFSNGRSVEAHGIVNKSDTADLALLYSDTELVRPLPIATASSHVGDDVVALGSPEGLSGSMSTGIISGIRVLSGTKVLQTTAPISHGSSGGPLLNANGEVIGMTSFMLQDGQNLNFAYPGYFLWLLILTKPENYSPWDGSAKVFAVELETRLGLILTLVAYDYLPHGKLSKTTYKLDAAGFVEAVYAASGLHLPKGALSQAKVGYDVPRDDMLCWTTGDRLYFACNHPDIDHTGMYIGNGYFVHLAMNKSHQVAVERVENAYYASHLVCVRRSHELLTKPIEDTK